MNKLKKQRSEEKKAKLVLPGIIKQYLKKQ
jgi:hypothetical protein